MIGIEAPECLPIAVFLMSLLPIAEVVSRCYRQHLNVDDDASCVVTHAIQPCLLHCPPPPPPPFPPPSPNMLLHLCRLVWVQELIVSAAVLGAGLGSAIGGWLSDKLGRKKALLLGDVLFAVGALLMAAAHSPTALITGDYLQLDMWQSVS